MAKMVASMRQSIVKNSPVMGRLNVALSGVDLFRNNNMNDLSVKSGESYMTRKGLGKLLAVVGALGVIIMLSGCSKENKKVDALNFYNLIQLRQSKDEVDAALKAKPKQVNGEYIYIDANTGFGVSVFYDSDNLVYTKALYNADNTKIFALSDASVTEDQLAAITPGMTYEQVKELLGTDGLETITKVNPNDENNPTSMMIWFNDDNTGLYVLFNGYEGTVENAKYWK